MIGISQFKALSEERMSEHNKTFFYEYEILL